MKISIMMMNETGLHARPAVLIAKKAKSFQADVHFYANGKKCNATDVLGLMVLGVTAGTELTIETSGEDEITAAYTLAGMITGKEIYK